MVAENGTAAVDAAVNAARQSDRIFVTSRGVRLRLTPVPMRLVTDAPLQIPEPRPPSYKVDGEDRLRYDMDDPEYVRKRNEYLVEAGSVSMNILVALGTAIEAVPDDCPRLEDEEWITTATDPAIVGKFPPDIPREGTGRYLAWMKYCVMGEGDYANLGKALRRLSGVVEEDDVQEIENSFPGDAGRVPNSGLPLNTRRRRV